MDDFYQCGDVIIVKTRSLGPWTSVKIVIILFFPLNRQNDEKMVRSMVSITIIFDIKSQSLLILQKYSQPSHKSNTQCFLIQTHGTMQFHRISAITPPLRQSRQPQRIHLPPSLATVTVLVPTGNTRDRSRFYLPVMEDSKGRSIR